MEFEEVDSGFGSLVTKRNRSNRGPNFQDHERQLLFQLVRNYRSIVDHIDNSHFMRTEKLKIWETITSLFNSSPEIQLARTITQLRDFYDNTIYIYRKRGFVPGGLKTTDIIPGNEVDLDDTDDENKAYQRPITLSDLEKQLLLQLIDERHSILGNASDVELAVKARKLAWAEIARVFNSAMVGITNQVRMRSELQKAYEAHKQTLIIKAAAICAEENSRKAKRKKPDEKENLERTTPASGRIVNDSVGDNWSKEIANSDAENEAEMEDSAEESNDQPPFFDSVVTSADPANDESGDSDSAEELTPKRARGPHFTNEERTLLMDLVAAHEHTVSKRERWTEISSKFNQLGISSVRKTKDQLMNLYKRQKKRMIKNGQWQESPSSTNIPGQPCRDGFSSTERIRSNYTDQERFYLISLVKAFDEVNKSDQGGHKKRDWAEIAQKFNSSGVSAEIRTEMQLFNLFKNKGYWRPFREQLENKKISGERVAKKDRRKYRYVVRLGNNKHWTKAQSFTPGERKFFMTLLDNLKTFDEKDNRAWALLTAKFNEAGLHTIRSKKQLRWLYKNLDKLEMEELRQKDNQSNLNDVDNFPADSDNHEEVEVKGEVELKLQCSFSIFARWVKQKEYGGFEDDSSFLDHLLRQDAEVQPRMDIVGLAGASHMVTDYNSLPDEMDYDMNPADKVHCFISEDGLSPRADSTPSRRRKASNRAKSNQSPSVAVKQEPSSDCEDIDLFDSAMLPDYVSGQNDVINKSFGVGSNGAVTLSKSKRLKVVKNKTSVGSKKKKKPVVEAIPRFSPGQPGPNDRSICELCGTTFKKEATLKKHMVLHGIGQTLNKCEVCGKCSQSKMALRDHMLTHTKEKPYVCQFCSKSYSGRSTLNLHIRKAHTRENLFYCSQCPKGFATQQEQRNHEIRHQGGIHKCTLCGYGFVLESQLIRHMFRKHKIGVLYECDCGGSFVYLPHFEKHLRVHHHDLTEQQRAEKLANPSVGAQTAASASS